MNIAPLIDYFNNILPLNDAECAILEEVFKQRRIKRRQFILHEGDICQEATFVVTGCFKMYYIDDNGKEHNIQFAIENNWIGDIGSFHAGEPTKFYVEALENSLILQINKPNLYRLYDDYPKFNRRFRVMKEHFIVHLQRRLLQNISTTAEGRYLDFLKRSPHYFNRISNVQIASYLGVTPEFLSTIRKKIANQS
ncbi:cyclic nucleotide-binding protein [marine bacterium AO1-C]|nr:cyclic nucleotide-binding protein [marine bacterium AO1-C]